MAIRRVAAISTTAMPSTPRHDADTAHPPVPSKGARWLFVGHLVTVWGLALSNVLHGLALVTTAVRLGTREGRPRPPWRAMAPVLAPLGCYALLFVVSVAMSIEPGVSRGRLSELVSLTTLPLALLLLRGGAAVRRVVDAILVMACVVAVYGIVQYHVTDLGMIQNRIPGPFSHYQTFAGVLMVGDLLLLGRLLAGQGWRRPLSWGALILINGALMMTLTRGPWVGVAVTLTAFILFRSRRLALGWLVVAAVAVVLMPASWSARISSISDLRDPSNYDRVCMLEAGLYMIDERPLFGLGPGMVRERYPIYRHPTAPRYTVAHLHNTFAQLAAERGLLSLASYVWLMAVCFVWAWRRFRRHGGVLGADADLDLGTLMVLVGFNVAGLFEANWRDTEVQRLVLFVLAMPFCLGGGRGVDSAPLAGLDAAETPADTTSPPPSP